MQETQKGTRLILKSKHETDSLEVQSLRSNAERLFIYLFIYKLTHLFMYSFIYLFVNWHMFTVSLVKSELKENQL